MLNSFQPQDEKKTITSDAQPSVASVKETPLRLNLEMHGAKNIVKKDIVIGQMIEQMKTGTRDVDQVRDWNAEFQVIFQYTLQLPTQQSVCTSVQLTQG